MTGVQTCALPISERLERVAKQFPAMNYETSSSVAGRGKITVVVHESFFKQFWDGAYAIEQTARRGIASPVVVQVEPVVETHHDLQELGQRIGQALASIVVPKSAQEAVHAVAQALVDGQFSDVGLLQEAQSIKGEPELIRIVLTGDRALEAVRELLKNPVVAQAAATGRLAQLLHTVSAAANGAVALKPEWFEATTETPAQADVAIGPFEWLSTMEVETKVVLEAPADGGKTVSAASAFYAGIEAVASGNRKLPPEVRQKLGVAGDEGLFTVEAVDVASDVKQDLEAYQRAVAESGVKG